MRIRPIVGLFLLTALLGGFRLSAAQAEPLPADKSAMTEAQLDRGRVDWAKRNIAEPLSRFARDWKPTDRHLKFMVDSYLWADRMFAVTDRAATLAEADALLREKPTDPWLRCAIARELLIAKRAPEAWPLVENGVRDIKASDYPAWIQYFVAMTAAEIAEQTSRNNERNESLSYGADRLVAFLAAAEIDPRDERYYYMSIRRPVYKSFPPAIADKLVEQIAALKTGNEWLRANIVSEMERDIAWKIRGNGFANEVRPDAWPGFEKHLRVARTAAKRAHSLRPEYPEAANRMIGISRAIPGLPDQTPRYWFDQSVKAQFDYHPAYFELLVTLRPRWGGSHEEMFDFVNECVATERYDTRVPYVLLYALELAGDDVGRKFAFLRDKPELVSTTTEMLDRYVTEYSDELKTADNPYRIAILKYRLLTLRPQRAAIACWTEDWTAGRAALDKTGLQVDTEKAAEWGFRPECLIGDLVLFTGPAAVPALAARQARHDDDPRGIKDSLAEATAALEAAKDLDPKLRQIMSDSLIRWRTEPWR
ncbi:MAG TPA: hypothetical protein VG797_05645 [Phycisphaerales bacterium]|nr:hypothetical protein [Phycisphaerales bacterium]